MKMKQMKMKIQPPKICRHSQSSPKREIYSNTSLPQEIRKISNKQSTLIPEELEKEQRVQSE